MKNMLIKVTCNNCEDVTVYDEEYMTAKNKKTFDCCKCRNNNKEHCERKTFLKKDGVVCFDLDKFFGRYKGFKFETITEEEFEKMKATNQ